MARRDRLVVRTLRCGRSNPGSNPGPDICLLLFIITIVVIIIILIIFYGICLFFIFFLLLYNATEQQQYQTSKNNKQINFYQRHILFALHPEKQFVSGLTTVFF